MMSWADQSWMLPEGRGSCYKRYRVAQGVHRPALSGAFSARLNLGYVSLGLLFVIGAFRATSLPVASGLLAFTCRLTKRAGGRPEVLSKQRRQVALARAAHLERDFG